MVNSAFTRAPFALTETGQIRHTTDGKIADYFDAADGTTVIGRKTTYGGAAWSIAGAGATALVTSNNMRLTPGTAQAYAILPTNSAFGTLNTSIRGFTTTNQLDIHISYVDALNSIHLTRTGSSSGAYRLFQKSAGTDSPIGTTTTAVITVGDVISITRANASIVVKVNGTTVITSTSTTFQTSTLRALSVATANTAGGVFGELEWIPA